MKKFFIGFVVALFMTSAVYAESVYAESRVNLEGSFAIRAWDTQDFRCDGCGNKSDKGSQSQSWWEQRLRVGGKIDISDGISAHFRMDLGEGPWGLNYSPPPIARPGYRNLHSLMHIDRAYLQIDRGEWALTVGQQYMGLGIAQVFDATATGLVLALDYNPVTVALIYAKLDEHGSKYDYGEFDDLDGYAINVAYTASDFNTNIFYVKGNDGREVSCSTWALGFHGSTKVGIIDLLGELAFLGGDMVVGPDRKMDLSGTQLYLAAETPINDRVSVGAEFMYAESADHGKMQLTTIASSNTFSPMSNNTPLSTEYSAFPADADAFDPFLACGGVVAGTIFADFTINELITAGCKIGYFEGEGSHRLAGAELLAYNMWVQYQLAPNTYLSGTYMVSSADSDIDLYPEDKRLFVGQLVVNF